MITLKRTHGNDFLLMKTLLRQRLMPVCAGPPPFLFRQARRSQIARAFRLQAQGRILGFIDGKYSDEGWYSEKWQVHIAGAGSGRLLSIGCVIFNFAETEQIRKWALAKRRKK